MNSERNKGLNVKKQNSLQGLEENLGEYYDFGLGKDFSCKIQKA